MTTVTLNDVERMSIFVEYVEINDVECMSIFVEYLEINGHGFQIEYLRNNLLIFQQ